MAVELRCPDCRAKLRLKVAPETGTEVECPKCGTTFPAPEPEPDADEPAPKKKAAESDGEKKGKKDKTAKAKNGAAGVDPKTPKKRRAKKKVTRKTGLVIVICASVLMLALMSGVLIWFFTRTSKAVEMFYYAPEDAQVAWGMNLGHAQKYPAFYKSLSSLITGAEFKPAGDAIGKAAGTDLDGLVEYVAVAESKKNGSAIVFRTKTEFDGGSLSKIPGAEKKTLDGKTYYVAPNLLPKNETGRVFAPTNRLVVVCTANAATLNDATFKKMINGHPDSKEKTLGVRMGALGKRVTRGTFWQMVVFDPEMKMDDVLPPQDPTAKGGVGAGDDSKTMKRAAFSDGMNNSNGIGVKASLGSREVRFEIVIAYKDSDKSSNFARKMKESDLGKGDEGTPPRWFKDDTMSLGDKKIAAQVLSNIGFGSSSNLFYVKSAVDTVDLQAGASGIMGKVLGISAASQRGTGTGLPSMPTAPPTGGGPPPPPPKPRRRREWVRG